MQTNHSTNRDITQASNHAKYALAYHIVLVTKYRAKSLTGDTATATAEILPQLIARCDCRTLACNVQADHVHLLIVGTPRICLADVLDYIKGNSARAINKRNGTTGKALWSKSYYVRSVSPHNGDTKRVINYINNQ